jgi:hypothetical protein
MKQNRPGVQIQPRILLIGIAIVQAGVLPGRPPNRSPQVLVEEVGAPARPRSRDLRRRLRRKMDPEQTAGIIRRELFRLH